MSALAAVDRIVQGALNRTPTGLQSGVEMVGQIVGIVERDTAYDEGERAMALLAMYGIVHRALLGVASGGASVIDAETDDAQQSH